MRWSVLRTRLKLMAAAGLTIAVPFAVALIAVILDLARGPEVPAATSTTATASSTTTATTPTPPSQLAPPQLAERYAPVLRLDSAEQLIPISRDRYVENTELWKVNNRVGRHTRTKETETPEISTLPTRAPLCPLRFKECHYYLQLRGVGRRPSAGVRPFLAVQQEILREGGKPIVYWHWADRDHTLQYWFFYDFNYFTNWHASDWEQITLSINPATGIPERVGYSSHESGQGTDWAILIPGYGRIDDHPVVFVARGSHANYFNTGKHPVRECRYLGPKICRPDRADGLGPQLTSAEYRLIRLDHTPSYAGDYGSGNFIKTPVGLKAIGTHINVGDPQARHPLWERPSIWLRKNRRADP
jgi:hypothetical protein